MILFSSKKRYLLFLLFTCSLPIFPAELEPNPNIEDRVCKDVQQHEIVSRLLEPHIIATYCHDGPIKALVYSPDGSQLAAGDHYGNVIVRDNQGNTIATYNLDGEVSALAYSPDGSQLAATDHYGNVIVRDNQGNAIATYNQNGEISALAYSPDGTHCATCGNNSKLTVWDYFGTRLSKKQKESIKTVRHYIFAKTIMDCLKSSFYLNQNGHETWQELKDAFQDQYTCYHNNSSEDNRHKVWKLVRKKASQASKDDK